MAEQPTREVESKVIPPKDPDIRYPDVAAIPPGQHSVIIIPKEEKLKEETPIEAPLRSDKEISEQARQE